MKKISKKQEKIAQNKKMIRNGIKKLDDKSLSLYKEYIINDYIKDCEEDFGFIKIYYKAMFRDMIKDPDFYELIEKNYKKECEKHNLEGFDLVLILEERTENIEQNYFYPIFVEYEINKLLYEIKYGTPFTY